MPRNKFVWYWVEKVDESLQVWRLGFIPRNTQMVNRNGCADPADL